MKKALLKRPETAVDVFNLLPEGVYCQVINNVIYMSPAPSFQHQDTIGELFMQIRLHAKKNSLGTCVVAPVDVFFDKYNAFQPDIIFISKQNMDIVGLDGKIHGVPDIVIEVLSPGNANDDKIKKKKIYEQYGVKEYFIVEPVTKELITYYHNGKKFEESISKKGKLVSRKLKKTIRF
jgi:Uma2 family endonuclease